VIRQTMTNPITPPLELLDKWCMDSTLGNWRDIAAQAAQWGANQELEACCAWLREFHPGGTEQLRCSRRPNPPSLKKRALQALGAEASDLSAAAATTIRRALEALDD
jgi:hypothetical protein